MIEFISWFYDIFKEVIIIKRNSKDTRKTKTSKVGKVFKIIFLIIIVAIVIFSGVVFGMSVALYDGNWKACLADIASNFLGGVETKYVLILGVSEDISTELTDTMMVAGYNPDTGKAFLVSIPRDTFVGESESRAKASDKINAQYQKGIEDSLSAAEKVTGLEINDYIVVKTSMLIELVDLIGGVEFDVPIDMDYDDPTQDLHIHLSAGTQVLNGEQAEGLLRFRHNNDGSSYPGSYGDNDFGRMKTQREFIKAVASQTLSFGNITKINSIINAVSDNLITNMSTSEILAYIPQIAVFDTSNLVTEQIPGETDTLNRISFFLYDEDETSELMSSLVSNMNATGESAE